MTGPGIGKGKMDRRIDRVRRFSVAEPWGRPRVNEIKNDPEPAPSDTNKAAR